MSATAFTVATASSRATNSLSRGFISSHRCTLAASSDGHSPARYRAMASQSGAFAGSFWLGAGEEASLVIPYRHATVALPLFGSSTTGRSIRERHDHEQRPCGLPDESLPWM